MDILKRLRGALGIQERSLTWDQVTGRGLIAPPSTAGVDVTHASALGVAAFWRGVQCYTSTIGSLPRHVYKRTDEGREKVRDHYLYPIVHDRANPHMSDQTFFELVMHHALTCGNFYAEIEWSASLKPRALWPLNPNEVEPKVTPDGQLYYRVTSNGKTTDLEAWRVIHVPGFGFDGYKGYSVIAMARQSFGLTIATERFGGSYFGNGTWPGLVMQHPKELSTAARGRIEQSLRQLLSGPDKAHGLLVMEEGATVQRVGMAPEDSQFLETRQHQVQEVARWLCLPPHKVGHAVAERPGGSLEASQVEFYTDSIRPWLVKIEKELNFKLLPESNRDIYIEHDADAILRGDSATRYANYQTAISAGFMSPEIAAAKENLPKPEPKPEPAPMPDPTPAHADATPDPAEDASQPARKALRAVALRDAAWLVRLEASDAHRAAKGDRLAAWAPEFYAKHRVRMAESLAPFGIGQEVVSEYCERHAAQAAAATVETIGEIVREWEAFEPSAIAEKVRV